jgi:hypothetical protein
MEPRQQRTNRESHEMALSFRFATESDIPALLKLRLAVDADQARRFGKDRSSTTINEKSVARGLKSSRVLLARRHGRIIGPLRMATKKPWAIDLRYFSRTKGCVSPRRRCGSAAAAIRYRASAYRARESCCPRVACRGDSPRCVRRIIRWRTVLQEVRVHRGRARSLSRCAARLLRVRAPDWIAGTSAGRRSGEGSGNGDWWYVTMQAPTGTPLTSGTYNNATRWPFQASVTPGLDVSGEGRGWNRSWGSFIIPDASFGPNGKLQRFHATFEQRCEQQSSPGLRGEIRVCRHPGVGRLDVPLSGRAGNTPSPSS